MHEMAHKKAGRQKREWSKNTEGGSRVGQASSRKEAGAKHAQQNHSRARGRKDQMEQRKKKKQRRGGKKKEWPGRTRRGQDAATLSMGSYVSRNLVPMIAERSEKQGTNCDGIPQRRPESPQAKRLK